MINTALKLANQNKKRDPHIISSWYFPVPNEIRLIEITNSVATTDEVVVFDLMYDEHKVCLILFSPKEWEDCKTGKLSLPAGWDLELKQLL